MEKVRVDKSPSRQGFVFAVILTIKKKDKKGMILSVCEIFNSIQGETSYVGLPASFIRLQGCNIRCAWCDTGYSYDEGMPLELSAVLDKIDRYRAELVVVTGGEPLLQREGVFKLMDQLCDKGYNLLLETNGSMSIEGVDKRVTVIMDIKCPGSLMHKSNYWQNIKWLKDKDEIKFVVAGGSDFQWALDKIKKYNLAGHQILITPVTGKVDLPLLAGWIKDSHIKNMRLNLQVHKYIWDSSVRGV